MSKIFLIALIFSILSCVASIFPEENSNIDGERNPLITHISQRIVDVVADQIVYLSSLFQLKVRVVRFLSSLYTTDNLVLLRDLINHGMRFMNFVLRFLPASNGDPAFSWITVLLELFNPSLAVAAQEATSEITVDEVTSPPVFFNAPKVEDSNYQEGNNYENAQLSIMRPTRNINVAKIEPVQHLTNDNHETVNTLMKLINARKR
ncbi:hypothetical protein ABEB36_007660 [Hypothenemus hampei]|uniref:Uncharacterized protein n=1 Tax=Hypothenemus hampei TaxID=57062 RepID=A0ABD1EXT0_HYPHA